MLSFKRIAERAITTEVDGQEVDLRYPAAPERMELQKFAASLNADDESVGNSDIVVHWERLTAKALQLVVVTDEDMTEDDWMRVIRASQLKAVDGLPELVKDAMTLCGFDVVLGTEGDLEADTTDADEKPATVDHVDETHKALGQLPTN